MSGSVDTVREILDLGEGEEEEKITKFLRLSNVWAGNYIDTEGIALVSSDVIDLAVNFYAVYLMRLTSERFSGDDTEFAVRWKRDAEEILKRGISSAMEMYVIRKVNDNDY